METKDKAKEIVDKFYKYSDGNYKKATIKKCQTMCFNPCRWDNRRIGNHSKPVGIYIRNKVY